MTAPNASFLSAGFLVTRKVDRSQYHSPDLLPSRLISASSCICTFIPDTWAIEWASDTRDDSVRKAAFFGLDKHELPEIQAWITHGFQGLFRWPNVCPNIEIATNLVRRYLGGCNDIIVFELALHESYVEAFCRAAEPPPPKPGFAEIGRQGVHEVILERRRIRHDGHRLGFEPLEFYTSLSCSWLCNGLEKLAHDALGIRPNAHGLIEDFEDARKVVELISRPDTGAEPGLWLPWLLIDHTDTVRQDD